jgi:hypothetical protein
MLFPAELWTEVGALETMLASMIETTRLSAFSTIPAGIDPTILSGNQGRSAHLTLFGKVSHGRGAVKVNDEKGRTRIGNKRLDTYHMSKR